MIKRSGLAALAVIFFATSLLAAGNDLSALVQNKDIIKVYVKDFVNESGQGQILAADFKKALENTIANRKSVKFELVLSPGASDVQISGVIKKYLYSEADPITSFAGPTALLVDAVTTENYAELVVDFTVTDTKSGGVLWEKSMKSFVKHTMTPAQSIPMVYEKLSRDFLWKSFGKRKT